jgi:hypothetical protein
VWVDSRAAIDGSSRIDPLDALPLGSFPGHRSRGDLHRLRNTFLCRPGTIAWIDAETAG